MNSEATKKILAIRHVEIEHLGEFEKILNDMKYKIKYFDVWREQIDRLNINSFNGFIILGGYMGVYEQEKYTFLKNTFDIAERAIEYNKPILGVCLGSQILAHILGAKVFKGHKKEIGWFDVFKVGKDEIFKDFPERFKTFHWHGDTFDLPKGAKRIFSSDEYENQCFVYGKAVGIQFHLEVNAQMVKLWAEEYKDELKSEGIDMQKITEQEFQTFERMRELSYKMLSKIFE